MFRRLPALALAAVLAAPAGATTITILNQDGAYEGFNDATPVAPVTGNPATTRGAQRLAVFQAAADYWEKVIQSPITIKVEARIDPMAPCNISGGVLGTAGPKSVYANFTGAPIPSTWYVAALADARAGSNINGANDIVATFNSAVDDDPSCIANTTWWYGIGAPAPAGKLDFYRVVLHEIGHGLGVLPLVNPSTGVKCCGVNPLNDAYMVHLENHSTGEHWSSMTNAERVASAIDTNDLHWTGAHAVALGAGLTAGKGAGGHINMYAPSTVAPGSSVSHWTNGLSPNELMEPFLTSNGRPLVTFGLLRDIGWTVKMIFDDNFEAGNDDAWSQAAP
jgi:hypothetical protein